MRNPAAVENLVLCVDELEGRVPVAVELLLERDMVSYDVRQLRVARSEQVRGGGADASQGQRGRGGAESAGFVPQVDVIGLVPRRGLQVAEMDHVRRGGGRAGDALGELLFPGEGENAFPRQVFRRLRRA